MSVGQRRRSLLLTRQRLFEPQHDAVDALNVSRHDSWHVPRLVTYTTKEGLPLGDFGPPLAPKFGGEIVRVWGAVKGAPTGTLTFDVWLNSAVSIFGSLPTIEAGQIVGEPTVPDIIGFSDEDYLTVKVVASNGAVGPLEVHFDVVPEV